MKISKTYRIDNNILKNLDFARKLTNTNATRIIEIALIEKFQRMNLQNSKDEELERLQKEVEDYKNRRFYLEMKDRWTDEDFKTDEYFTEEIKKLEKRIEELKCIYL